MAPAWLRHGSSWQRRRKQGNERSGLIFETTLYLVLFFFIIFQAQGVNATDKVAQAACLICQWGGAGRGHRGAERERGEGEGDPYETCSKIAQERLAHAK